jgi:hypothetical protein
MAREEPMTSPKPHPAAPWRRPWRRAALVLTVLAGLFLMHGMSSATACHGGTSMLGMASPAMHTGMTAMPDVPSPQQATVAAPATGDAHTATGDSCTPLRPDGPIGLLLVFAAVVLWGLPRIPSAGGRIGAARRGWTHGPPRPGVEILFGLGICRT